MTKKYNAHLYAAKKNKNDEFYTRLSDIEKEMPNYFQQFRGKSIMMPADDYRWSNFVTYFKDKFHEIGLKKITATNFDIGDGSFKYVYDGEKEEIVPMDNGDFFSDEVQALMMDSDIIITNPPFSKFKIFIHWLFDSGKEFIVVGNKVAMAWKTVFPYYLDGKVRFGYNIINKFICGKEEADLEGIGRWYTNLKVEKNNTPIKLVEFNCEVHKKYDTLDAINCDSIRKIPDIDGVIGVPIGILDYNCEEQFEIIGMACRGSGGCDKARPYVDGKEKFCRILIKKVKKN